MCELVMRKILWLRFHLYTVTRFASSALAYTCVLKEVMCRNTRRMDLVPKKAALHGDVLSLFHD